MDVSKFAFFKQINFYPFDWESPWLSSVWSCNSWVGSIFSEELKKKLRSRDFGSETNLKSAKDNQSFGQVPKPQKVVWVVVFQFSFTWFFKIWSRNRSYVLWLRSYHWTMMFNCLKLKFIGWSKGQKKLSDFPFTDLRKLWHVLLKPC